MSKTNTKSRVAIFYRLDSPGGVQTCVCSLIRGLNNLGIVPDILWDLPPSEDIIKQQGISVNYKYVKFAFPSAIIVKLPSVLRLMVKIISPFKTSTVAGQYDFIYFFSAFFRLDKPVNHLFYLSGPPMLPQLENPGTLLSRFMLKALKKLHEFWISPNVPIYQYNSGINYVINSKFTRKLFKEAHDVELEVIYPPLVLKSQNGSLASKKLITYFSRIVSYKNPEIMIELARGYPDECFLIMGSITPNRKKYLQSLMQKIEDLNLNNIRIVANPSEEQITTFLDQTKVYIFPGINEHFGITTVEAIKKGAIPLVHDSGGQMEVVPFLNLRFDRTNLNDKLEALINIDEDQRKLLISQLQEHLKNFDEHVFLEKILNRGLYNSKTLSEEAY